VDLSLKPRLSDEIIYHSFFTINPGQLRDLLYPDVSYWCKNTRCFQKERVFAGISR